MIICEIVPIMADIMFDVSFQQLRLRVFSVVAFLYVWSRTHGCMGVYIVFMCLYVCVE